MTSSLPNEPLWPRAGRSGSSAAAIASSSLVAPSGNGAAASGRSGAARRAGRTRPAPCRPSGLRPRRAPPVRRPAGAPGGPGSCARGRRSAPRCRAGRRTARRPCGPRRRSRPRSRDSWRDRQGDPAHPELLGAGRRPAVEPDRRLAGRQPFDLDVLPADPPDAQAQDLADGLLGGPPAGERLGPVADVAPLGRGQDPVRRSATPNRSIEPRIRSTLMMSMPSSVVPGGTSPGGSATLAGATRVAPSPTRP